LIDPDDLALFRAAVADAEPLAGFDRVQLPRPKPRRVMPARLQAREQPAAPRRAADPEAAWPEHWRTAKPPAGGPPRDPELAALQAAMAGVRPLARNDRLPLAPPPPPPRPLQHLADERAALHESLHGRIGLQDRLEGGDEPHHLRPGLAVSVLRDLRRGRWVIQGEIDLHGLNRDEARHALAGFLAECLHAGRRCVRVIHGKGLGSPQKQSVLRQLVRGWLAQRIEVLAYCQAKPQDGGEGALLVLLRAPKRNGAA